MLTEKNSTEIFAYRFKEILQDILNSSEELDANKLRVLLSKHEYSLLIKLTAAIHKVKKKEAEIENSSGISV